MNAYVRIRAAMRDDEQTVLRYVREIRRRKANVCRDGECWPPSYLYKAIDRLEAAGVIVHEAHFGREDTERNRARGIHFRAKRGAQPVTEIVR